MYLIALLILLYIIIGIAMVIWDFRSKHGLHEPPQFISDRSISTDIMFTLIWPDKLLSRLFH